MNVLFIGLGIIGQRHLRNLRLKYKDISFYTLKNKHSKQLYNSNKAIKGNVQLKYNLRSINLPDINKKIKVHAAFICLPNYLHAKYLKILVEKKIHVFLEKPCGINKKDCKILVNTLKKIKRNKLKVVVGYHLRFNPLISKVKTLIKKKEIGKILNVLVENGEHIADYRPYQKYWKVYHSKKKEGGGVLLNQIHEIDYFLDLFDNYKFNKINSLNKKISNLKINTEDTTISNFIASNLNDKFILTLLMNSFERPKRRLLKIVGSKGKIIVNLLKNYIEIYKFDIFANGLKKNKKTLKKLFKFKIKRKDLFKREVNYFINSVKKNTLIDKKFGLERSIETLKTALKLKN